MLRGTAKEKEQRKTNEKSKRKSKHKKVEIVNSPHEGEISRKKKKKEYEN